MIYTYSGPHNKVKGSVRGREEREEGKGGREGRGGVDPWPPAPKTIIRHWCRNLVRESEMFIKDE